MTLDLDEIGNYVFIKTIGSGSFATVYLAEHKYTRLRVAIKVVSKTTLDSQEAQTRFNRECAILKQMDHPFIAELFEIIENDTAFFLVMEYVEHGNMLEFVNSNGRLSEDRARRYFCQLVAALDYLHNTRFIAHRDLKAENVLLDRHDNIRLIDFGLSNVFTRGTPQLRTACGSPAYAAPEMIQGCPYTKAADMWSAGILLYAMVARHLPFDDSNIQNLLQKVVFQEVQYPPIFSRSLVDLLKRLLTKNPEERITIQKLKEHPWFSQSEYAMLMEYNFHDSCQWRVSDGSISQSEQVIDKEIVDRMVNYGIDVSKLAESILLDEFTPLTSVYRQLRKDKITDQMKDMLLNMQRMIPVVRTPSNISGISYMMNSHEQIPRSPFPNCESVTVAGEPFQPRPQTRVLGRPMLIGAPDLLNSPAMTPTNKVYTRRMSRPIAVRRIHPPTSPSSDTIENAMMDQRRVFLETP